MKKQIIFIYFIILQVLSFTYSYSQNAIKGSIPTSIINQLPTDFKIFDFASGDLNKDGRIDYIIVLKSKNGNLNVIRPMYIFLDINAKYQLFAINNKAIGDNECGGMYGDCYKNIVINKGRFSIEYYGGSGNNKWLKNATFNYNITTKEIYLIRFSEAGSKTYGIEPDHKNADRFVTFKQFGVVRFKDYNFNIDYFKVK